MVERFRLIIESEYVNAEGTEASYVITSAAPRPGVWVHLRTKGSGRSTKPVFKHPMPLNKAMKRAEQHALEHGWMAKEA
jgi:hypothetical protein